VHPVEKKTRINIKIMLVDLLIIEQI